ncbi:pyocin knob domain-containing protein [Faecalibaculum rodentium]|uniref:pyocin knob domain-containing protein n=1 Tax=Faecalibaculum rodentium TaxID=1702221 RepID=UPI0027298D44|nr:hypothetical protein [Faecalibaculum rodentium]
MAEKAVSLERLKRYFAKEKEVFAAKSHTHNYAGSSSAGGSANSAVKLDSNGGSSLIPSYFTGGKPTACGGKVVPTNCERITDWNAATSNGFYMASGATNAPVANQWFFGEVISHNVNFLLQRVWRFTQSTDVNLVECYERMKMNGTWGSWRNVRDRHYPVGTILITHDNVNPGTRLGGTWVAYAPGRVLVGVGTGNDGSKSVTFRANSAAGQYQHNHGYSLRYNEYFATANKIQAFYAKRKDSESFWYEPGKTGTTANAAHTTTNSSAVSTTDTYTVIGATDYNLTTDLIPYQTAYFWRRTA